LSKSALKKASEFGYYPGLS